MSPSSPHVHSGILRFIARRVRCTMQVAMPAALRRSARRRSSGIRVEIGSGIAVANAVGVWLATRSIVGKASPPSGVIGRSLAARPFRRTHRRPLAKISPISFANMDVVEPFGLIQISSSRPRGRGRAEWIRWIETVCRVERIRRMKVGKPRRSRFWRRFGLRRRAGARHTCVLFFFRSIPHLIGASLVPAVDFLIRL